MSPQVVIFPILNVHAACKRPLVLLIALFAYLYCVVATTPHMCFIQAEPFFWKIYSYTGGDMHLPGYFLRVSSRFSVNRSRGIVLLPRMFQSGNAKKGPVESIE